jgi:hypothetical protein
LSWIACTYEWFVSGMCSRVDVEMGLLGEAFAAVWQGAGILALLAGSGELAFVGEEALWWGHCVCVCIDGIWVWVWVRGWIAVWS